MRARGRAAHKPERIEDKGVRRMEKQGWGKEPRFLTWKCKTVLAADSAKPLLPRFARLPGYLRSDRCITFTDPALLSVDPAIKLLGDQGNLVTWVTRVTRGVGESENPWRRLVLHFHVKRGDLFCPTMIF
jgi:hypothetical protein